MTDELRGMHARKRAAQNGAHSHRRQGWSGDAGELEEGEIREGELGEAMGDGACSGSSGHGATRAHAQDRVLPAHQQGPVTGDADLGQEPAGEQHEGVQKRLGTLGKKRVRLNPRRREWMRREADTVGAWACRSAANEGGKNLMSGGMCCTTAAMEDAFLYVVEDDEVSQLTQDIVDRQQMVLITSHGGVGEGDTPALRKSRGNMLMEALGPNIKAIGEREDYDAVPNSTRRFHYVRFTLSMADKEKLFAEPLTPASQAKEAGRRVLAPFTEAEPYVQVAASFTRILAPHESGDPTGHFEAYLAEYDSRYAIPRMRDSTASWADRAAAKQRNEVELHAYIANTHGVHTDYTALRACFAAVVAADIKASVQPKGSIKEVRVISHEQEYTETCDRHGAAAGRIAQGVSIRFGCQLEAEKEGGLDGVALPLNPRAPVEVQLQKRTVQLNGAQVERTVTNPGVQGDWKEVQAFYRLRNKVTIQLREGARMVLVGGADKIPAFVEQLRQDGTVVGEQEEVVKDLRSTQGGKGGRQSRGLSTRSGSQRRTQKEHALEQFRGMQVAQWEVALSANFGAGKYTLCRAAAERGIRQAMAQSSSRSMGAIADALRIRCQGRHAGIECCGKGLLDAACSGEWGPACQAEPCISIYESDPVLRRRLQAQPVRQYAVSPNERVVPPGAALPSQSARAGKAPAAQRGGLFQRSSGSSGKAEGRGGGGRGPQRGQPDTLSPPVEEEWGRVGTGRVSDPRPERAADTKVTIEYVDVRRPAPGFQDEVPRVLGNVFDCDKHQQETMKVACGAFDAWLSNLRGESFAGGSMVDIAERTGAPVHRSFLPEGVAWELLDAEDEVALLHRVRDRIADLLLLIGEGFDVQLLCSCAGKVCHRFTLQAFMNQMLTKIKLKLGTDDTVDMDAAINALLGVKGDRSCAHVPMVGERYPMRMRAIDRGEAHGSKRGSAQGTPIQEGAVEEERDRPRKRNTPAADQEMVAAVTEENAGLFAAHETADAGIAVAQSALMELEEGSQGPSIRGPQHAGAAGPSKRPGRTKRGPHGSTGSRAQGRNVTGGERVRMAIRKAASARCSTVGGGIATELRRAMASAPVTMPVLWSSAQVRGERRNGRLQRARDGRAGKRAGPRLDMATGVLTGGALANSGMGVGEDRAGRHGCPARLATSGWKVGPGGRDGAIWVARGPTGTRKRGRGHEEDGAGGDEPSRAVPRRAEREKVERAGGVGRRRDTGGKRARANARPGAPAWLPCEQGSDDEDHGEGLGAHVRRAKLRRCTIGGPIGAVRGDGDVRWTTEVRRALLTEQGIEPNPGPALCTQGGGGEGSLQGENNRGTLRAEAPEFVPRGESGRVRANGGIEGGEAARGLEEGIIQLPTSAQVAAGRQRRMARGQREPQGAGCAERTIGVCGEAARCACAKGPGARDRRTGRAEGRMRDHDDAARTRVCSGGQRGREQGVEVERRGGESEETLCAVCAPEKGEGRPGEMGPRTDDAQGEAPSAQTGSSGGGAQRRKGAESQGVEAGRPGGSKGVCVAGAWAPPLVPCWPASPSTPGVRVVGTPTTLIVDAGEVETGVQSTAGAGSPSSPPAAQVRGTAEHNAAKKKKQTKGGKKGAAEGKRRSGRPGWDKVGCPYGHTHRRTKCVGGGGKGFGRRMYICGECQCRFSQCNPAAPDYVYAQRKPLKVVKTRRRLNCEPDGGKKVRNVATGKPFLNDTRVEFLNVTGISDPETRSLFCEKHLDRGVGFLALCETGLNEQAEESLRKELDGVRKWRGVQVVHGGYVRRNTGMALFMGPAAGAAPLQARYTGTETQCMVVDARVRGVCTRIVVSHGSPHSDKERVRHYNTITRIMGRIQAQDDEAGTPRPGVVIWLGDHNCVSNPGKDEGKPKGGPSWRRTMEAMHEAGEAMHPQGMQDAFRWLHEETIAYTHGSRRIDWALVSPNILCQKEVTDGVPTLAGCGHVEREEMTLVLRPNSVSPKLVMPAHKKVSLTLRYTDTQAERPSWTCRKAYRKEVMRRAAEVFAADTTAVRAEAVARGGRVRLTLQPRSAADIFADKQGKLRSILQAAEREELAICT